MAEESDSDHGVLVVYYGLVMLTFMLSERRRRWLRRATVTTVTLTPLR